MSQEVPASDILFGSAVLAVFLFCAYWLGRGLTSFRNARLARAWSPLIPVIGGVVTGDGSGAVTSWLTGTYRGRRVRATMVPDRNRYHGESGSRFNYFDAALLDVPGSGDWKLAFHEPVLGFGRKGWHVEPENPLLQSRLLDSGAIERLSQLGSGEVSYSARERSLLLTAAVGSAWIPVPGRFQEMLELLLVLAAISEAPTKA